MDLDRVKFFSATLVANSFLHFYSTEFLKTTTVDRMLHNWALMFAANEVKADPNKRHLENLRGINFYCTPAIPKNENVATQSYLLNPVPEQEKKGGDLSLMRIEKFLPGSEFGFIIMSKDGRKPPNIISYGKKKSHHTLKCGCMNCANKAVSKEWHEIKIQPIYKEQIKIRTEKFINPLDFKKLDEIAYAKKHPMRPSPLYIVDGKFHDVLILPQLKEIFPNNFPYSEWTR